MSEADKSISRTITLIKKGHYHQFRYLPGEEAVVLQELIRKAQDPESPLDWFDAAVLSHQMGSNMASEFSKLLNGLHGGIMAKVKSQHGNLADGNGGVR